MSINKHGLTRYVPSDVAREIRQRCGFGCVICGFGFYDYEHFAPDFSEAKEHNPDGMTLLCSQCNQKRARQRLSAQTVAIANANPKCLQQGFANEMFDFGENPIEVRFAGSEFYACKHLIVVNDIPIFTVTPSPGPGVPVQISGKFTDHQGKVVLTVKDNVWKAAAENWDVECVGPRITVRTGRGQIALVLRMEPPQRLVIERLEMYFKGVYLRGNDETLDVSLNGKPAIKLSACSMSYCYTGISLNNGPPAANQAIFTESEYEF